ncbi:hypothetical protein PENANT_c058G07284 [Penicillium antarcticum]|uniref:Major facilitator superfamily (MFS) profile domain-containing protein n=1 Tax=Penicillium antarcticum TaxID=416450 RepID=A0A1V6PQC4_9EURO|nr:hypothetical protein PENANT_c058G07284 [Penicillium antarcticum]
MWQSPRDVKLLCAQRFVRLFAYGGSMLILASYLNALDISEDRIGLFMTLTLGSQAVLSLGSLLMAASGVVFAAFGNYWALLPAAVLGVISPSGNEIGPFRAVEESTLAHLTPHEHLRDIFSWYSLIGTAGAALGNLMMMMMMMNSFAGHHWEFIPSCRFIFLIYAGIGVVKFLLTVCLSRKVEAAQKVKKQNEQAQVEQGQNQENSEIQSLLADQNDSEQSARPSPKKGFFESIEKDLWWLVIRLFILFGLDSFASGLASPAWMIYFFKRKFNLPEGQLGSIFSITSVISALSMLAASSIAKRIGNVKTMVFTHLPSAFCERVRRQWTWRPSPVYELPSEMNYIPRKLPDNSPGVIGSDVCTRISVTFNRGRIIVASHAEREKDASIDLAKLRKGVPLRLGVPGNGLGAPGDGPGAPVNDLVLLETGQSIPSNLFFGRTIIKARDGEGSYELTKAAVV